MSITVQRDATPAKSESLSPQNQSESAGSLLRAFQEGAKNLNTVQQRLKTFETPGSVFAHYQKEAGNQDGKELFSMSCEDPSKIVNQVLARQQARHEAIDDYMKTALESANEISDFAVHAFSYLSAENKQLFLAELKKSNAAAAAALEKAKRSLR